MYDRKRDYYDDRSNVSMCLLIEIVIKAPRFSSLLPPSLAGGKLQYLSREELKRTVSGKGEQGIN